MTTLIGSTPRIAFRSGHSGKQPTLHHIGGRRLLRALGKGGMSQVYLGYDEVRRVPVAIKVLLDDLAKNSNYVDRFRREAEIGHRIHHPNIVHCREAGQDAETGRRFLVLEYVQGVSAQSRLENGPLPLAEAARVIFDIARALEELHYRGYVHRDVKPGNIMIGDDGRAKLADLGVAKLLVDASELTALDQGIGTPYYMPWEQTLNASLVDQRSDLFALGATFYHIVTGKVPFPGKDVAEVARMKDHGDFEPARNINPKLPPSVDMILARLMARMPADRFQQASQLIDALSLSGLASDGSASSPLSDTEVPPAKTLPELKAARKQGAAKARGPAWIFQYQTENGWKRGKARALEIVQWFEDGILPDDFLVARPGQITCRHFRKFPEFQDLRRRPKTAAKKSRAEGLKRLGLGICLALLTTAYASTVLHMICGVH